MKPEDYLERVRPDETMAFDFIDHLARYEYAERFVNGHYVLDCGCGNGYGSFRIAPLCRGVEAIDVSRESIAYAQSHYTHHGLTFHCMNGEQLSFAADTFDVVLSFEVIEHVPHADKYLQEIVRVLRPGGMLLLSTPNKTIMSPGSDKPLNPFHLHEFTKPELEQVLSISFTDIHMFGEFEDQTLASVKESTRQLRSQWHRLDFMNVRQMLPADVKRKILNALVRASSGSGTDDISESNIYFSADAVEQAPTFFVEARKKS